MHTDEYGLIVQKDLDGGDTAQREGFVWTGLWFREHILKDPWPDKLPISFEEAIDLLEINKSGLFRRHPNPTKWWSDPAEFSRDQQTPIVAAMGLWGLQAPLDRLWEKTIERGNKCQNADVVGPEQKNLFLRLISNEAEAIGEFTLSLMVPTIIARANSNWDDVGDDLNFIVLLLVASQKAPTETSEAIRKAYSGSRPVNYGCYLEAYRHRYHDDFNASKEVMIARIKEGINIGWNPDCSPIIGALRWYFREESGGNPDIAEIYKPIIDYLFT